MTRVDLTPTETEDRLRHECRDWLHAHLPWEYGKGFPPRFDDLADEVAFGRSWQQRLAADRWVGVAWPEEYGGRAAGPIGHYIVTAAGGEQVRAFVPPPLPPNPPLQIEGLYGLLEEANTTAWVQEAR